MVLDGPMTGEWFTAYAKQVLAPTLRTGDIVTLDNLPAHKVTAARQTIEAAGARMLFLPPYSPDLNPIENAFSKLKSILRKAAARNIPELWDTIRDALPRFTAEECTNYFSAAGYEPE
ncbi:transposase [Mesorhizobium sp. B2-4-12]|nr:transposase [Mesorhizobium sp. B2-4-12]TPL09569.1 transposase [Mesorhizobium sp. B2-4-14]